jgi:AcrR family transcriptional regulator
MTRKIQTRERDAEHTKAAILESATALFAQKGYAGTSMSDLAGHLGIAKGTIYHHFENKEALFHSLVDSLADDMEQLLVKTESTKIKTVDRSKLLRNFAEVLNAHREIVHLAPMHMVGAPIEFAARASKLMERMQKLLVGKNPTKEDVLRARSAIIIIARLGFSPPSPFLSKDGSNSLDMDLMVKVACSTLEIWTVAGDNT